MSRVWATEKVLQKTFILQAVRRFFAEKKFLEVDTPILQTRLVPELHAQSFSVVGRSGAIGYLLPSPELAMKRLLCQWNSEAMGGPEAILEGLPTGKVPSIYQLAHCFRQEDEQDELHFWEFLMLEFYAIGYTSLQLLELVRQLLGYLGPQLRPDLSRLFSGELAVLSFDELCRQAVGLGFDEYWDNGLEGMQELYAAAGGTHSPDLSLDDLFHLFLVNFLEPYIGRELPFCALYPYPDVTPLPARQLAGRVAWVERWELYVNGVELANACREENRREYLELYRQRFVAALEYLGRSAELARFDLPALKLWRHLPDCSGAALGLDRLLAL